MLQVQNSPGVVIEDDISVKLAGDLSCRLKKVFVALGKHCFVFLSFRCVGLGRLGESSIFIDHSKLRCDTVVETTKANEQCCIL